VKTDQGSGPLAGVRVIELAAIGPLPFAGLMLAQLGAQVTYVDRPADKGVSTPLGRATQRPRMTQGRDVVAIDLRRVDGAEQLLQLVEAADVLLEGHRPGVMERLGVGPDVCLARNPRLVYGRMTGWGQSGPMAHAPGHDLNFIALTGALHAIGPMAGPPQIPLNLVGDYGGGALYLVVGVVCALLEARELGRGQVVDAAIVDGTAHMLSGIFAAMAEGTWRDQRGANLLDGGYPFYSVYATRDGRYMAVTAVEPQFYAEFIELLGIDEVPGDQMASERWPDVRAKIAAAFAQRTRDDWTAVFAGSSACVGPVLSLQEAADNSHLRARGTVKSVAGQLQIAPAPRFSNWPT
jgi:alpha-methylacyl-CoA racemase